MSGSPLFAIVSSSDNFTDVGVTQHSVNGTASTGSATFISETSGTVGLSISGTVEGGADFALAHIKASVTSEASASVSVTVGNQATYDVAPGTTLYGAYGSKTVVVHARSSLQNTNCGEYNVTYPTVTAPTSVGWRTWTA